MRNNRLPLYIIFLLVGIALVYRVAHPPAPPIPGPIGGFPTWTSVQQLGQMASQSVNPAGTMWAGAWNFSPNGGTERSAVWVIDFEAYEARPCLLPGGTNVQYISWADDGTIRAWCDRMADGKGQGIVSIDAATAKVKSSQASEAKIARVICWPGKSDILLAETTEKGSQITLAALSLAEKAVGKEIAFALPKDGALYSDAGVAADGSSFVFSISDPAAKAGRAYYLADTKTGTAKKAFDLGDVPGKIEGIYPSAAGVLLVCRVKETLANVIYDPATGKLGVQDGGVGDLAKWPGAPKSIGFTTYTGGYEFDLATGKTTSIFDMSKRTSDADERWRDSVRDSRLYRLKSGNLIAISESAGATEIREIKKDGTWYRNLITRFARQ